MKETIVECGQYELVMRLYPDGKKDESKSDTSESQVKEQPKRHYTKKGKRIGRPPKPKPKVALCSVCDSPCTEDKLDAKGRCPQCHQEGRE